MTHTLTNKDLILLASAFTLPILIPLALVAGVVYHLSIKEKP